MANVPLRSIKFPDLPDTYTVPQIDATLSIAGRAADAKAVGDKLTALDEDVAGITITEEQTTEPSRNLFNLYALPAKSGVTYANGVMTGTTVALYAAFKSSEGGLMPNFAFKANMQYTLSFDIKNNIGGDNAGAGFEFVYTDGTVSYIFAHMSDTEYTHYTLTSAAGKTVSKLAFTFADDSGQTWQIKNIQVEEGAEATPYAPYLMAVDSTARYKIDQLAIKETASGTIATFTDGADNVPMPSVKAYFNPVQSGSGNPSPQNIRPISGWTGLNVMLTKENLLGGRPLADAIVNAVNNTSVCNYGNDSLGGDFVSVTAGAAVDQKAFMRGVFKPNTQYTVVLTAKKAEADANSNITVRYTDGTWAMIRLNNPTMTAVYTTWYVTETGKTVASIETGWGSDTTYLYYNYCGVFEGNYPDYTAYAGNTYPVTWQTVAGTLYGGYVDLGSGVLTKTWGIVDLGSLDWGVDTVGGYNRYGAGLSTLAPQPTEDIEGYGSGLVCDRLVTAYNPISTNDINNAIARYDSGIYVRCDDYSTVEAFKAGMNGAMLVYELKTPQTYQLTPQQVKSLLGLNNVWNTANGNTEVTYCADTKLYIDKAIAAAIANI